MVAERPLSCLGRLLISDGDAKKSPVWQLLASDGGGKTSPLEACCSFADSGGKTLSLLWEVEETDS